jgi:hypothetical protein
MFLNAQGQKIESQPITIQIDMPSEAVGNHAATLTAVNWGGVLGAAIQLVIALMSGNQAAVAAAIQALINAIVGN